MDSPNKEQIKAWLKAHNRDRQWLADQLGKALQTINNWLSSAKPIPGTILALIAHLMADDAAAAARRKQQLDPIAQVFSLEVDLPTFRAYSQAAKAHHQTIEEWAIDELNAAAAQDLPLPPPFASRLNAPLVPYVLTPDEAEIVRLAQQQAQAALSTIEMGTNAQRRSLQDMVSCDRIGWDAIQHRDGWWVGTDKGVTCYGDHRLARVALTIIWQREGGRQLNYRIKPFTGANVASGEHTPKLSAVDALNRYETKAANVPDQTPAALDSANTTDASSRLSASVLLGVGGIGEDWQEKVKELASAETAHRISWHHLEEFIRKALVEELRALQGKVQIRENNCCAVK